MNTQKKTYRFLFLILAVALSFAVISPAKVNAMPFYDLQPKELVLRSAFYTSYTSSSEDRKNNISVASKSLNNVFVDCNCEFSFNLTARIFSTRAIKKYLIFFLSLPSGISTNTRR